jgi:predicted transcriptional regulator YheO
VIDERERRLAEAIHHMRQVGTSIERIAIWLMTQREYPNKRKFDNYKAVEWAIAAKEMGFPRRTDSKQLVREWRGRSPANV